MWRRGEFKCILVMFLNEIIEIWRGFRDKYYVFCEEKMLRLVINLLVLNIKE